MQRLIAALEKKSLLRVHCRRLRWRDEKSYVVDELRTHHKTGVANPARDWLRHRRLCLCVPPRAGHLCDRVIAADQHTRGHGH
eukprot:4970734-Prymnesium_polylepis.5